MSHDQEPTVDKDEEYKAYSLIKTRSGEEIGVFKLRTITDGLGSSDKLVDQIVDHLKTDTDAKKVILVEVTTSGNGWSTYIADYRGIIIKPKVEEKLGAQCYTKLLNDRSTKSTMYVLFSTVPLTKKGFALKKI